MGVRGSGLTPGYGGTGNTHYISVPTPRQPRLDAGTPGREWSGPEGGQVYGLDVHLQQQCKLSSLAFAKASYRMMTENVLYQTVLSFKKHPDCI
jgi:hypothetical protein